MAHEVLMPKLSSTMTDGTITMWLKNEGDSVEIGEAIFEVMTDKIAIEVEAYEEGILLKRYIGDGESAPINSVIAYIGEKGEEVPDTMPLPASEETQVATEETVEETTKAEEQKVVVEHKNVRATPAARRLAREKGIVLKEVKGTGPKGRVQVADVANFKEVSTKLPVSDLASESTLIPWGGMRKAIADKMQHSSSTIPHVTMNAEVDMTNIVALRKQLLPMIEEQIQERISFLEIIIKATMVALKTYPEFNAHGLEEGIKQFTNINMGVAVSIPEGLIVPVVQNANTMGLSDLTKSVKEVTAKAREGRLEPREMSGGTFTISSLGRSKVREFTPIINAPEVAILGVGGMFDKLTVTEYNGMEKVESVPTLNLCLSFDHRVVDGAPAAAFLSTIVEMLENPMSLLL